MIDLTTTRSIDMQSTITDALDDALTHRGDIEMAKGAIMLGFGTDPEEAFAVLRAASNHSNLKVSVIAHRIVSEFLHEDRPSPSYGDVQSLISRVTQPDYESPKRP